MNEEDNKLTETSTVKVEIEKGKNPPIKEAAQYNTGCIETNELTLKVKGNRLQKMRQGNRLQKMWQNSFLQKMWQNSLSQKVWKEVAYASAIYLFLTLIIFGLLFLIDNLGETNTTSKTTDSNIASKTTEAIDSNIASKTTETTNSELASKKLELNNNNKLKEYELHITLYQYYLTLGFSAFSFFCVMIGGILAYILKNYKESPEIIPFAKGRWKIPMLKLALLLPIFMSSVFFSIFIYGAFKWYVVQISIIALANDLRITKVPDLQILIQMLGLFGAIFLFIGFILLTHLTQVNEKE